MPSHDSCYVVPKTDSEYGKNSAAVQNILGRCAEQTQNIIDIFTNSIDIFENSTDIFTNFNDILTFIGTAAEIEAQQERVDDAHGLKTQRSMPSTEAQPKNIKK